MQLYLLAQEYRDAAERLADLDLPAEVIADTLESLSGGLEKKAVNVACVARNLQALAASIKEAEEAMAARRKAIEARSERLMAYLLDSMLYARLKKIESPHFSLSIRSNPVRVDVFDSGQIPEEFMRHPAPPPAVPDKKALKEAIEGGQEIPGVRLVRMDRIEIK